MIWLLLGVLIGYILHRQPKAEECPREVLRYTCRGENCDHRKSKLYEAMATMARNEEDKVPNIFRGGI